MNWSKEFSGTELFFIILFFSIYCIYLIRVFFIAKKLKISANSIGIKFLLRTIYFGLLILGLLGPNFGITEIEARATSKEIYLAIDLSNSMNAIDVEPSRIDKSKSELLKLIEQFKSDKIGIIVFNSQAHLYTPLTFDQDIIKNNIATLKTSQLSNGGTNYNSLLDLVFTKFNSPKNTNNHTKICIVFTDGENFEPIDNQYYKTFKKLNINTFFVGIGTSIGSNIPVNDTYRKDNYGIDIITKLDSKQLATISRQLNGNYYLVDNQKSQIASLITDINLIKNINPNTNQQIVTNNKYIYFLLLALFLIFLDFLISINILKL